MVPFSLLAQTATPVALPPVEMVLQRAVAQAEKEEDNNRAFRQRYGYARTKVTEYRNSKGELKKREEKKSVKNPAIVPIAYRLPPTEERPNQVVGKTDSVNGTTTARGKAFERNEFVLNEDLLNRFVFTLVRREMANGRPALVLDFQPAKRKLPERNIKERFINKAAGRVWLDEAEYALLRADLHLTEKVNVVGGLVGAVTQFNYQFNRERTADGLWFTRAVNWHLEGREVFVQRTIDHKDEKTDVRKVQ